MSKKLAIQIGLAALLVLLAAGSATASFLAMKSKTASGSIAVLISQIVTAFAGLGIFLYGMILLESALREAAGRSFKAIIKKTTQTIPRAVATGAFTTAVLQSSSLVSLIVLSLVGAGLMALESGIGVIFGANIGTTATAWLVATLGFNVHIEEYILPALGIGGLMLILAGDSSRISAFGKLIFGLIRTVSPDVMNRAIPPSSSSRISRDRSIGPRTSITRGLPAGAARSRARRTDGKGSATHDAIAPFSNVLLEMAFIDMFRSLPPDRSHPSPEIRPCRPLRVYREGQIAVNEKGRPGDGFPSAFLYTQRRFRYNFMFGGRSEIDPGRAT
jgi:hypothetical protein